MAKKRASKKKSPLIVVNVKLTPDVRKALLAKAKRYADGNLSAWFRSAGTKYVPKTKEKKT